MIFNSDHPSRCGENRLYLTSESTRSGSPPRTRGKPCVLRHTHLFNGITPAGAGKTKPLSANAVTGYGSPPQVRGKPYPAAFNSEAQGITPAGAGKTRLPARTANSLRDHPRRCGENVAADDVLHRMQGSPPQVRGKRIGAISATVTKRITPAGAGKTVSV